MARVRLFANLRELAGASAVELPGTTVAEVLEAAGDRYGNRFREALASSQVWVDGERVDRGSPVEATSEVAVIPPVSGGSMIVRSPMVMEFGLVAAFAAGLLVANAISLEWLAVVVVPLFMVWVYDVAAAGERRGLAIGLTPGFAGVVGGVLATYRFGAPGMAAAVVGTVLLSLVWSVLNPRLRPLESIGGATIISATACFGASSLVLTRMRSWEEAMVFLVLAVVAVSLLWLSDRSDMPLLDPMVGMILGAVAAGVAAAAIWAPDMLSAAAASVAASIALVAGNNVGTLARAGGFFAAGWVPGSLAYFDGVAAAAGAYWALLTILG